jgi:gamma-glutamylputrescine oxidase
VHRMPQIGELGPGVWLASGFGGQGLNTTAMAGNLIARAIVDGDQTWREFTPFELVWAGGLAGRIAVQARNWIKRFRSAMAERESRARERAHLKAREAERIAREAELAREASEILHAAAAPEAPAPQSYAEPEATAPTDVAAEPMAAAEAEQPTPPAGKGRNRSRRKKRRERSEEVS